MIECSEETTRLSGKGLKIRVVALKTPLAPRFKGFELFVGLRHQFRCFQRSRQIEIKGCDYFGHSGKQLYL